MQPKHRLAVALAVGTLAAAVPLTSASANVSLTQVSSDPYTNTTSYHATEVEPDTFASGSTMVSVFQAGRFSDGGSSNIGWATTTDGGSTYSHGFLPSTTVYATPAGPYARATDPSVAFDPKDGRWLISSLVLNSATTGAAVIVNSSADGITWSGPTVVGAATRRQDFDKDWIVCDGTSTSPHYGNCYVEWDDFGHNNQLHMAVSSDGGSSWKQSSIPKRAGAVLGGQPLVQPDGTVLMPIGNGNTTAIESFVSTNGGSSYTGPFAIGLATTHVEGGNLRSGALPSAEIDKNGKVYVVWSDCRFISGCSANDLVVSSSTDGKTWSAVTRIPIDSTTSGVDHFLPGLGVDSTTTGHLALTYYYYPSTSCSISTCELDVGFVSSSDGGSTWSSPVQLAGPTSMSSLPDTTQGFMVGDYISTSYVTTTGGRGALSVFAVGNDTGKTCTVGDNSSCNEPMEAPASALSA